MFSSLDDGSKKSKVVISGETLQWKDAEKRRGSKVQLKNKSNMEHKVINNKSKHKNMESCNGGQIWKSNKDEGSVKKNEENRLNTNHDRMHQHGQSDDFVSEKAGWSYCNI